jgi:serine/threonine protein kinase
MPLDELTNLLPQIFNAVGYTHMHRSRDGVIRRLPHLYLTLSAFFLNEEEDLIKLDSCAVWRSLVETRGHKAHLYEEPGIDLSALAPEAFVLSSKFVKGHYADIYALGALLYRLATGKAAFSASNAEEYSFAHLRTFPVPPKVHRYTVPSWMDRMILKAMEKELSKRWRSATQMELTVGKDFHD